MKNFIPRPYQKTAITVRIDNDKIDEYCKAFRMNRSEFINRSIDFAINNIESDEFSKNNQKNKSTERCFYLIILKTL